MQALVGALPERDVADAGEVSAAFGREAATPAQVMVQTFAVPWSWRLRRCWIRYSRERYDARTIGCLVPAASQKQNKAFAPISLIANGGAMPEPTFTVRTKESKRHLRCSRARA
jgi:hypothetical protein